MKVALVDVTRHRAPLVALAALLVIIGGVDHLAVSPLHGAHEPVHGLFLALAGIVEIIWAVAFWYRPSARSFQIGVVLTGGLLTLYALSLVLPAPFGDGPEVLDAYGTVC